MYLPSMKKTMLVAGCALVLGSTVTASDFATGWLNFSEPQQDLIDNLGDVLRSYEQASCQQQQQEALQRYLALGIPCNSAILMAQSQYPCDWTDEL